VVSHRISDAQYTRELSLGVGRLEEGPAKEVCVEARVEAEKEEFNAAKSKEGNEKDDEAETILD